MTPTNSSDKIRPKPQEKPVRPFGSGGVIRRVRQMHRSNPLAAHFAIAENYTRTKGEFK